MASRNYLSKLRRLIRSLDVYCARWDQQIRSNLTSEQQTLFGDMVSALATFRASLGSEPEGD